MIVDIAEVGSGALGDERRRGALERKHGFPQGPDGAPHFQHVALEAANFPQDMGGRVSHNLFL